MDNKDLILLVQQLLNTYCNANLDEDSIYGPLTQGAINSFEEPQAPTEGHFVVEEFTCQDGVTVPDSLMDNLNILIVEVLEKIRELTGDKPLYINSGYRTQSYNDDIYGKKNTNSMHILAGAADISSSIGVKRLGVICKKLYDQGIIGGLGLGKTCVHVDVRHIVPYANDRAIWYYNDIHGYSEWKRTVR